MAFTDKIFGLVLVLEGTVAIVAMVIRCTKPCSWQTIWFSRQVELKKDACTERDGGEGACRHNITMNVRKSP